MTRWLLVGVTLLAGCDDDSLPAKVADVQLHGFVAARIECSCEFIGEPGHANQPQKYRAQRLLDGSCLVGVDFGKLWDRAQPESAYCPTSPNQSGNFFLEDGLIKEEETPGSPPVFVITRTADIETCCTGFNLEAFGVE